MNSIVSGMFSAAFCLAVLGLGMILGSTFYDETRDNNYKPIPESTLEFGDGGWNTPVIATIYRKVDGNRVEKLVYKFEGNYEQISDDVKPR